MTDKSLSDLTLLTADTGDEIYIVRDGNSRRADLAAVFRPSAISPTYPGLNLNSGAVINWNSGDVTLTHAANTLTLAGGQLLFPDGTALLPSISFSTDATTGRYMPAAGQLGFAISAGAELLLTATAFSPAASDGQALGTTTLMWADLFLATGAVVNWNNGGILITESADSLNFTGAGSGYSFDSQVNILRAGLTLRLVEQNNSASVQVASLEGDRATMTDNDEAYVSLKLSDDAGTQTEVGRLTWIATDVNVATSVDAALTWSVMTAGSLAAKTRLEGSAF